MPTHPFTPSPEQHAIFSAIGSGTGNLIIEAVAGSGKTTTIIESLKYINPSKSVLYLAFNKSIADELESRVPSNVKAATFHRLGLAALKKLPNFKPKIDQWKVSDILRSFLDAKDFELYGKFCSRLVSFAKGAMGIGTIEEDVESLWLSVIESHEMFLDEDEGADYNTGIKHSREALKRSIADNTKIDFDDMLYLPLLKRAPFATYDYLFVDEAQDTNAIQRTILAKSIRPSSRLIAVGDPSQAIYGFRGADGDAMNLLAEKFKCQSLPLSVSHRCASRIVEEAQKYQTVK